MTYNEKKSLYESIMKDVAKSVKRHLNENEDSIYNYEKEYLTSHRDTNGKLNKEDKNHLFMAELVSSILKLIHKASPNDFNKDKLEGRMKEMFRIIQQNNMEKAFVDFILKNWD